MYATLEKKGKLIAVWGNTISFGSVSTTAALVAAGLASEGKKTLIMSTDKGPYDGVSITSDLAVDNLLDDLVILASSGGIRSEGDFMPYVQAISENLSCLKGSNDFMKLSVSAPEAIHRILDMALYIYDYVVVDVYGLRNAISDRVVSDSDLVLFCASQNMKHLDQISTSSIFNSYLDEKNVMLLISKYQTYPHLTIKNIEKILGVSGFYTLSDDDEIHAAVCKKNVADYVFKNISGTSRGILIKKKGEQSVAMEELSIIVNDIIKLFKEEEEARAAEEEKQKNKAFLNRRKKEKAETEKEVVVDNTPAEDRPAPPQVKKAKREDADDVG